MRELLNLFSETESRDELGIGQVRDAFSDLLFPGTSTLHTRPRYLLIVPWCYIEASRRGATGERLEARVERNERTVIATLRGAGEVDGMIGRVAGVAVKVLPSSIYSTALERYGISFADPVSLAVATDAAGEADELVDRAVSPWHPTLPTMPAGFPSSLPGGLNLLPHEAAWLRDRMRASTEGTLLQRLVDAKADPDHNSDAAWNDPAAREIHGDIAASLEHAELFSLSMHGASLLYNLLIAERYNAAGLTKEEERLAQYTKQLGEWAEQGAREARLQSWDRSDMWSRVTEVNGRIGSNRPARQFIESWLEAVVSGRVAEAATDEQLRQLVAIRERSVKKGQSRLTNERLLRTWSGASGTRQLNLRWPQIRRLVIDIHDGLAAGNDDPA